MVQQQDTYFQDLAEKAMSVKEREKVKDKYKKDASKIVKCGALLSKMGHERHEFLLSIFDLQKLNGEFSIFRSQDTTNWTPAKKQEYRKKKIEFEKKYKDIYRKQHDKSILIEAYHEILCKRLEFDFEFSANNMYMATYVAYACIKKDNE